MEKEILKNIKGMWDNVVMQGQIDAILSPIHEHHKLYYDVLYQSVEKAYNKGFSQGQTRVLHQIEMQVASKSDVYKPVNLANTIKKDKLFSPLYSTSGRLENEVFQASEKTIVRVDKDINKLLVEGYEDGVGSVEMGRRIKKRFNQLEGYESRRIARTEVHSAQSIGMIDGYKDLGVQYIQWSTHVDGRERDSHLEINRQIIPIDGMFSNNLRYPGDKRGLLKEWINCRCAAMPFIMPIDKMAPPGMRYFKESDLIDLPVKTQYRYDNGKFIVENRTAFDKVQTLDETAEYFGYRLEKTKTEYIFHNDVHKAKISFPRNYNDLVDTGEYEMLIDFENKGRGAENIKDILKMYDDTPEILKYANNNIEFPTKIIDENGKLFRGADAIYWNWDTGKTLSVRIAPDVVRNSKSWSLSGYMRHEMGHCLDYRFMNPELAKYLNDLVTDGVTYDNLVNNSSTENLIKFAKALRLIGVQDNKYGVSVLKRPLGAPANVNDMAWEALMEKEFRWQKANGFSPEYSSSYGKTFVWENLAETISISSNYNNPEKSMAFSAHGYTKSYDEWLKKHRITHEWVVNLLENTNVNDFILKI